ncbi:importin subunit alpha [Gregarina niphandrodes]|uniref:Importin subunit alpha n=1 Tax=Gregarina niphandrodes TaxID=110365 RepID=A0A023B9W3_GRENI|nr:importin subunit alpha [Gregarina niphandrodes]EZG76056.1 importin subunit alpha [Gregarina niphandrodes]|eukprot:XP_011129590.1 importin subunit alpha [Gregarina niphandrodes]
MESRIDTRRKDFKKSFEDPLRLRESEQVQIRKAAREARLNKKRMEASPAPGVVSQEASSVTSIPVEVCEALASDDRDRQCEAAKEIRHMLSLHSNPPIQPVIDAGLVPRFMELLRMDSRPDVQFEAAWALTNIASGDSAQTSAVVQAGAIPEFVRLLDSEHLQVKEQSVWALGNIAGDCRQLRDAVIQAGGFFPILRELRQTDQTSRMYLLRYATWTLSNFCRGPMAEPYEIVREALPVLRSLLYSNDPEIITDACWSISYMSDTNNGPNSNVINEIIRNGVCGRLVELLSHRSHLVQTPALRAVGNIVTGDDTQTQTMISYGCIPKLKELLTASMKPIRKEACWALSNVTAGNKTQIQEVIEAGVLPVIAQALANDDYEVRREAAWCVANAASGGAEQQVRAVVDAECIGPLVSVLDAIDPKVAGIALEAIENILKVGKKRQIDENLPCNPYAEKLEEAEAFPKLEKLQFIGKTTIQTRAIHIMTEYLEAYVDEPARPTGFGGMAN